MRTRVFPSAPQTIPPTTFVPLAFDSERWDDEGLHSVATNTSRLTVVTAGMHRVTLNAGLTQQSQGTTIAYIRVNGVTYLASDSLVSNIGGVDTLLFVSTEWQAVVGDYFEAVVLAYQAAASINTVVGAPWGTEFMAARF